MKALTETLTRPSILSSYTPIILHVWSISSQPEEDMKEILKQVIPAIVVIYES